MTGFGEGRSETPNRSFLVEVRAVNNRHLKVTVRGPEPYPLLEAEVEKIVRRVIRRGTLLVQVRRTRRGVTNNPYTINATALVGYATQIDQVLRATGFTPSRVDAVLAGVLQMPGVAETEWEGHPSPEEWAEFEMALLQALHGLDGMRRDEGQSMASELHKLQQQVRLELGYIRQGMPRLTALFRDRMLTRLQAILAERAVSVSEDQLVREVAIYADRCDVSEELTRLESHLQQFMEVLQSCDDSPGRRLEFLVQEMGREANTIGSKANDAGVSRRVVEMKAALEKIRELVQNIE
jgi:uncharacterized protein (TIGR00255 family)